MQAIKKYTQGFATLMLGASVSLTLIGTSACTDLGPTPSRMRSVKNAIIGGTRQEDQGWGEIVFIDKYDQAGNRGGTSTGVQIGPRSFLTAGHVTQSLGANEHFRIRRPRTRSRTNVRLIARGTTHFEFSANPLRDGERDLGVICIDCDRPPPEAYPGFSDVPVPVGDAQPQMSAYPFGRFLNNSPSPYAIRGSPIRVATAVATSPFSVYAQSIGAPQSEQGDSGGPWIYGETTLIQGITRGIARTRSGAHTDVFTRTDPQVVRDWISRMADPANCRPGGGLSATGQSVDSPNPPVARSDDDEAGDIGTGESETIDFLDHGVDCPPDTFSLLASGFGYPNDGWNGSWELAEVDDPEEGCSCPPWRVAWSSGPGIPRVEIHERWCEPDQEWTLVLTGDPDADCPGFSYFPVQDLDRCLPELTFQLNTYQQSDPLCLPPNVPAQLTLQQSTASCPLDCEQD